MFVIRVTDILKWRLVMDVGLSSMAVLSFIAFSVLCLLLPL